MKKLEELSEKFSKLKEQEKILLMVCAAVLAIFPMWSYGFDPAMQKYREAVKSAADASAKIEELSQKSDELASGAGISVNDQMKAEIAEAQRMKDEGKGDGSPPEEKKGKRGEGAGMKGITDMGTE